jgi:hypothetical protein
MLSVSKKLANWFHVEKLLVFDTFFVVSQAIGCTWHFSKQANPIRRSDGGAVCLQSICIHLHVLQIPNVRKPILVLNINRLCLEVIILFNERH